MRKINKAAIAAGAISALLIGIAPPAMAAGSSCTIVAFTTTCTTGTASANSSTHDIMILAQNCATWLAGGTTLKIKLQDVGTGQYFWYGSVPYRHEQYIRVSGLYGSYKLRLDGEPNRFGQITNTIGWTEQQRSC